MSRLNKFMCYKPRGWLYIIRTKIQKWKQTGTSKRKWVGLPPNSNKELDY